MFLLLAPSALTGKCPGLYCPEGQRSQDAPKSPKGEVRGLDGKEGLKKNITHRLLNIPLKQKTKIDDFILPLMSQHFFFMFKSLSRTSGNEIKTKTTVNMSDCLVCVWSYFTISHSLHVLDGQSTWCSVQSWEIESKQQSVRLVMTVEKTKKQEKSGQNFAWTLWCLSTSFEHWWMWDSNCDKEHGNIFN